jgi:hypothetical protein
MPPLSYLVSRYMCSIRNGLFSCKREHVMEKEIGEISPVATIPCGYRVPLWLSRVFVVVACEKGKYIQKATTARDCRYG